MGRRGVTDPKIWWVSGFLALAWGWQETPREVTPGHSIPCQASLPSTVPAEGLRVRQGVGPAAEGEFCQKSRQELWIQALDRLGGFGHRDDLVESLRYLGREMEKMTGRAPCRLVLL